VGIAGVVVLVSGLLAGVGLLVWGSPQAALAKLRGESLSLSAAYVDVGSGKFGENLETRLEIRNHSSDPIRLVGGTSDCTCLTTTDLPILIRPGDSQTITVTIRVPKAKPGGFTKTAELWTDCDRQRTIRFRVGYRVVE
jgi:uncharacterized membrane protein